MGTYKMRSNTNLTKNEIAEKQKMLSLLNQLKDSGCTCYISKPTVHGLHAIITYKGHLMRISCDTLLGWEYYLNFKPLGLFGTECKSAICDFSLSLQNLEQQYNGSIACAKGLGAKFYTTEAEALSTYLKKNKDIFDKV